MVTGNLSDCIQRTIDFDNSAQEDQYTSFITTQLFVNGPDSVRNEFVIDLHPDFL